MKKSATQLGREVSLTGQEMNYWLKEQGYLEGEPGDYSLTPKGAPFAQEHENHWGAGGYSVLNEYCTTRKWDETILDEDDMKLSEEDRNEVRTAVSERRRQQREELKAVSEAYWAEHAPALDQEDKNASLNNDELDEDDTYWAVAIGALIGGAIWWGASKAYHFIKDEVVPKVREKISQKESYEREPK